MPLPTETETVAVLTENVDTMPDDENVVRAAETALDLVTQHLGAAGAAAIPDSVALTAVVEVGAAVYYRRTARNGITTYGSGEVVPVRIAKDPMSAVYPMLAPWSTPGLSR